MQCKNVIVGARIVGESLYILSFLPKFDKIIADVDAEKAATSLRNFILDDKSNR